MKNFYYFLTILLFFNFNVNAQFQGGFEDCTFDGEILENSPWDWSCGGATGCGIVCSSGQAYTGNWSGLIPGDGTTDAILDLGNKIFGQWGLEFWMYIPSGQEAYWNLQGQVPVGAGEWIVGNVFFNQDIANPGIGHVDDSALGDVSFTFPHDQWFRVVMNFDISTGISTATWQFNIDGVDILPVGTPFTTFDGTSPTSLGGMDFFSISADNELYVDDFNFINGFIDPEPNPNPVTDDMESYTEGEPIYEGWWTDWSCGGTCALISSSAQAYSGSLSGHVPGDGTTAAVLNLGNKTSGQWALEFMMYIPQNKEGYLSLQGDVPLGPGEWIVGNIFFNQDLDTPGIGNIDDTALGNIEFNFPHDEWFSVIMNIDLTGGMAEGKWEFIIDGEIVVPEGTPFTTFDGDIPTSFGGILFFSLTTDIEVYLDDFNYIEGVILGTNDVNELNFSIYPNPAVNTIHITTTEIIKKINMYSVQGIIVKESSSRESIDISNLSSGMYFVEVVYDSGKSVQKLIKK